MPTAAELLKWLDDGEDIYIPRAATLALSHISNPMNRKPVVIEDEEDSDNDTLEVELSHAKQTSLGPSPYDNAAQLLANSEHETRTNLVIEAHSELNFLLGSAFHSLAHRRAQIDKNSTITHNRNLIAQDLIKELVEASQHQRSELKQVLGMFQTFGTPSHRQARR
ncbi:Hypothetical protein, putative [Bodo saltans]|uniref:Uncharacterized protein n=1 Tax=Bodo saltans TaxID=75058 RepID=A0A0S4JP79_BODSA|nr:Hypothetical protein, putative [Bodo saltans]|eukprot:CUG92090.1 Hypothetical protein, putative [Bodo saltans]